MNLDFRLRLAVGKCDIDAPQAMRPGETEEEEYEANDHKS